jgi:hypothetical protein
MQCNSFYVYSHYKPDGSMFYIGKGKDNRMCDYKGRNPHWQNIVKKHGKFNVCVQAHSLDEEFAYLIEKELIDISLRRNINLANKTLGGEGASGLSLLLSHETNRINKTGWYNPEVQRKGRESQKEKKLARFNSAFQAKMGRIGGAKTRELKIGIHADGVAAIGGKKTFDLKIGVFAAENLGKGARITSKQKWKCADCSMVVAPGPLGKHQKASGHVGKTKVN